MCSDGGAVGVITGADDGGIDGSEDRNAVGSADGADALAPKVKELASSLGGNFTTVPIQGFDQLFSKELWGHLREEGVRPAVPTSSSSTLVPLNDMSPCNGASLDDLGAEIQKCKK